MWWQFWHRPADAPSGGQITPAPTAPALREGSAPQFLTEQLAHAALDDPDKAARLNQLIRTTAQATIDVMRAEEAAIRGIQDAHAEQFHRRFTTVAAWSVGGAVVLVAALWCFGVFPALKSLHLPVPRPLLAGVNTVGFALGVWGVSAVVRRIRGRIARRRISAVTAPAESAQQETVVSLPAGEQERAAVERGGDPTQADAS